MDAASVSNSIKRGGTVIKTTRSERFKLIELRKKAAEQCCTASITDHVILGGNESFTGAHAFYTEYSIPAIGVPDTIDNAVNGSDSTIGFDAQDHFVS